MGFLGHLGYRTTAVAESQTWTGGVGGREDPGGMRGLRGAEKALRMVGEKTLLWIIEA